MRHPRFVIPLLLLTLIGCAVEESPVQTAAPDLPPSLFLTSPPANARSVAEVKESAALGDEVVIAGQLVGNRQHDDIGPRRGIGRRFHFEPSGFGLRRARRFRGLL